MNTRLIGAVVAVVLLVGGCGSGGDPGPTGPPTRGELETASVPPTASETTQDASSGAEGERPTEDAGSPSAGSRRPSDAVYQAMMSRCLTEKGWEVILDSDGPGYQVSHPTDQTEQFDADHEACLESSGFPSDAAQVSAEDAAALYRELVAVAECVRGQGFDVAEPPSETAFVEALVANPIPIWHPHDVALTGGASTLLALQQACPVESSI